MLKPNEFIIIDDYDCTVIKDDYARGEVGGVVGWWNCKEHNLDSLEFRFKSVKEALEKVCELCGYKFFPKNWMNWGLEIQSDDPEDYNRFDTDVMVDDEYSEATEKDLEDWKNRTLELFNCHIVVRLKVITERSLEKDELSPLTDE